MAQEYGTEEKSRTFTPWSHGTVLDTIFNKVEQIQLAGHLTLCFLNND